MGYILVVKLSSQTWEVVMDRVVGVLLLMIAFVMPVAAQDIEITAMGFYDTSCGSWTQARALRQAANMQLWAAGFLSGVNWTVANYGINFLKSGDAEGFWGWLDNYCRSHPLEKLPAATGALTNELVNRARN